ncbi:sensor domain-containing diguanylate cyclase [Paludibacterium purpuratum]|uniref:PAS domain S-box-containing protein/diguanylate cyclase (GGDEF)-like protein n=1 Tax=Paludibacterium purpuratum TaxID=1144873 RepID=A0A4R7BCB4_9NEIS|nr:diguanylate cyclase [Paludibacterium purpuratum]TDR82674.1 PAS domain S-box-containing protein/diguanylate cyclase (GGDEF)-like protein [Paludibacterium purpuratum]
MPPPKSQTTQTLNADQQAALFRAIADNSNNVVGVKDLAGRYLYVNTKYSQLFHLPQEHYLGRTDAELFPADTAAQFRANDLRVQHDNMALTIEEIVQVDGQTRHFLSVKFPIHDFLGTLYATGLIATDITARKAAEQLLWASEERFRLAFEQATVGMAMIDIGGNILRINPHGSQLFGYQHPELEGRSIESITHPQDRARVMALIRKILRNDLPHGEIEKRYLHKAGHFLHCRVAISLVRDPQGVPLYFVAHINDITETLRIEEELLRLANTDPLTGVANRRPFLERMQQELARVRRYGTPACCLMLDFDHFKLINDRWGHSSGDAVLRYFSQTCLQRLRATDLLGRLGGEEFAILMPDTALAGARELGEQLRVWVAEHPLQIGDQQICFSISLGMTELRADDKNPDQVLARTDEALYRAKDLGRNRVEVV